jgi:hypothetical protein
MILRSGAVANPGASPSPGQVSEARPPIRNRCSRVSLRSTKREVVYEKAAHPHLGCSTGPLILIRDSCPHIITPQI